MKSTGILALSILTLYVAIGAANEAWIGIKEREVLDAMKLHHEEQRRVLGLLDPLIARLAEGPMPEKGSAESKALGEQLAPLADVDLTADSCIDALVTEILAPGEYTPERLKTIRELRRECVAR